MSTSRDQPRPGGPAQLANQLYVANTRIEELEALQRALEATNNELEACNLQIRISNSQLAARNALLTEQRPEKPTSFLALPAEIRNHIYELSGCLKVADCRGSLCFQDMTELPFKRSCGRGTGSSLKACPFRRRFDKDGTPWPIRVPARLPIAESASRLYHHPDTKKIAFDVHGQIPPHQPNLTRVCRQVRNETLPLFYGHIVLYDSGLSEVDGFTMLSKDAMEWLSTTGQQNADLIRRLELSAGFVGKEDWTFTSDSFLYHQLEPTGLQLDQGVLELARNDECRPRPGGSCQYGRHGEQCEQEQAVREAAKEDWTKPKANWGWETGLWTH